MAIQPILISYDNYDKLHRTTIKTTVEPHVVPVLLHCYITLIKKINVAMVSMATIGHYNIYVALL
jgi:hypothetical protein